MALSSVPDVEAHAHTRKSIGLAARVNVLRDAASFLQHATSLTLKHDVSNVELTVWLPSDVEATWRAKRNKAASRRKLKRVWEALTNIILHRRTRNYASRQPDLAPAPPLQLAVPALTFLNFPLRRRPHHPSPSPSSAAGCCSVFLWLCYHNTVLKFDSSALRLNNGQVAPPCLLRNCLVLALLVQFRSLPPTLLLNPVRTKRHTFCPARQHLTWTQRKQLRGIEITRSTTREGKQLPSKPRTG